MQFSDEELDDLANKLCARIIPNLLDAMKAKITIKAKSLPPNLMDVEELESLLHVDRSWIYDRIKKNKLPAQKVGKYWRFQRAEIELLMAEGRLF